MGGHQQGGSAQGVCDCLSQYSKQPSPHVGGGCLTSGVIARVVVDSPLPHLDRLFDYDIPAELLDDVVVGCRVKVRFAGRLVDAFVLDLVEKEPYCPFANSDAA